MRNFNSNIEGVWTEKLAFTDAQLLVLKNGTTDEKKVVITESNIALDDTDTATAVEIYNLHKPTVENYDFIGCNLSIGDTTTGIINYRVGTEHLQIRF